MSRTFRSGYFYLTCKRSRGISVADYRSFAAAPGWNDGRRWPTLNRVVRRISKLAEREAMVSGDVVAPYRMRGRPSRGYGPEQIDTESSGIWNLKHRAEKRAYGQRRRWRKMRARA